MITEFYNALTLELQDRAWDVQLGDEYLNEQSIPPRIVVYPHFRQHQQHSRRNIFLR